MIWTDLFAFTSVTPAPAAPPRLGINFVQASAPEASIPISRATSGCCGVDDGAAAAMIIQQNLSEYGIAGVVWNCARALIFFLQGQPQLLAKKRVLELGAGTGAVGLALALHSRSGSDDGDGDGHLEALIMTDLERVVPLTTQNVHSVARDHATIHHMLDSNALSTQAYCWLVHPLALVLFYELAFCLVMALLNAWEFSVGRGDELSDSLKTYAPYVVLCSDCLYEPSQFDKLLDSLLALTDSSRREKTAEGDSSPLPMVLIAYKQRIPERERVFFESASDYFAITIDAVDGTACSAVGGDTIYICTLERLQHPESMASMG